MPRGAPRKPDNQRTDNRHMRWPRALWDRLCRAVPRGRRSKFVHQAVAEKLDREAAPEEDCDARNGRQD